MISKIISSLKSVLALSKIFSNEEFVKILGSKMFVQFSKELKSPRVLVLSTHPDDETIGCGGAILNHLVNQDNVRVIQLTDGSAGFPENFRPTAKEKREMAEQREVEANQVKDLLGYQEIIFLKYNDKKLISSKSLVNYLSQVIEDYEPTAVFVPYLHDPNTDHAQTAKAFYLASKKSRGDFCVFQYEVWAPLHANFYLNIDRQIETKLKAIGLYKSQLKCRNFIEAIEGLNKYRGSIHGKSHYAEAYLKTDIETFRKLAQTIL